MFIFRDLKTLLIASTVVSIILLSLFLLAQNKKPYQKEDYYLPMVVFQDKDKLWQLVTYDDDEITALEVEIYPNYRRVFKKVYINHSAQFVYQDASPIMVDGEPIFWNRAGDIITYDYKRIDESYVFYINGNSLKTNTALTLKELKENIKIEILKEADRQRTKRLNSNV